MDQNLYFNSFFLAIQHRSMWRHICSRQYQKILSFLLNPHLLCAECSWEIYTLAKVLDSIPYKTQFSKTHPKLKFSSFSRKGNNLRYKVVYICSSFLPVLCDLPQAEKKIIIICKAEQILKMTTTFAPKDNFVHPGQFWVSFF